MKSKELYPAVFSRHAAEYARRLSRSCPAARHAAVRG
jgi:hypothetical protein